MTKKNSIFKPKNHFFTVSLLLSVLSGFLIGTSYIPFPPWALLFCYVPLWWTLSEKTSLKSAFFHSWITQFILSLIGFNWIYYTAREFGQLPVVVSVLALLLFAALMHLYIPLSLTLAVYLKKKFQLSSPSFFFLTALLLSMAERLWPSLFAWNLGYTYLWAKWPIYQWADTVGFLGLSTLTLLFQASLASLVFVYRSQKSKSIIGLTILFISFLTLNFLGLKKSALWSSFDSFVNITVVQGNISNEQKLSAEKKDVSHEDILNTYIKETNDHLTFQTEANPSFTTDVILWPETALPFPLDPHFDHRLLNLRLQNQVVIWNSVLFTGAFSVDKSKKDFFGHPLARNSIFFLGPKGPHASQYNKSQLLAFGEYMPMGHLFPFLYQLFPFVGTFEQGPGPSVIPITLAGPRTINFGPQICYESLDPAFSRHLSKNKVDIIFNVTNDSWFGDWAEPYQHMIMTFGRAIENRKPLVRSTNTGITSAILANGSLLRQSLSDVQWSDTFQIKYKKNAPETFYTRWGHYDWILICLSIIFIIFRGFYVRKK